MAEQTHHVERDRGADGRARNARPRDGLGRPLAYGSPGVPRQPEGVARTPDQTVVEAQRLLDTGRPFHAHEVFEDAWKSAPAGQTALWKALAQLAVGLTHRMRGNAVGADRLLRRAAAALDTFGVAYPFDIDIARLVKWARAPADQPMPPLRSTRSNRPESH